MTDPLRQDDPGTFTIRVVSSKFGLTYRALRFYEQKGLISPARVGARRRYSAADVDRVRRIVAWTRAGLSLAEIGRMLELLDSNMAQSVNQHVIKRLAAIESDLQRQLGAIAELRREAA